MEEKGATGDGGVPRGQRPAHKVCSWCTSSVATKLPPPVTHTRVAIAPCKQRRAAQRRCRARPAPVPMRRRVQQPLLLPPRLLPLAHCNCITHGTGCAGRQGGGQGQRYMRGQWGMTGSREQWSGTQRIARDMSRSRVRMRGGGGRPRASPRARREAGGRVTQGTSRQRWRTRPCCRGGPRPRASTRTCGGRRRRQPRWGSSRRCKVGGGGGGMGGRHPAGAARRACAGRQRPGPSRPRAHVRSVGQAQAAPHSWWRARGPVPWLASARRPAPAP